MRKSVILVAVVSMAVLVLGFYLNPRSYEARVICMIMLMASLAQSWNLVGGLANQISLGHAAYFGIGAYTSTILVIQFGLSPWLGAPVGAVLAVIAALILSIPTMRLRGPYFTLATLAFAEAVRILVNWMSITGGAQGISAPFTGNSWSMLQFRAAGSYIPVFVGLFALTSLVFAAFESGRYGYMFRALRENEDAAEVSGVDTLRMKLIGSSVSAALAALCGTAFAQLNAFLDPETVFSASNISIRIALIAIVGGIGTLVGPLLGALCIITLDEVLNSYLSGKAAGIAPFIFGWVLIAMVLLRPKGLASLPGLRLLKGSGE